MKTCFRYVHNIKKMRLCNGYNTNVGTDALLAILATMIIYFECELQMLRRASF